MAHKYKVLKKHFDIFQQECTKWLDLLNLFDFKVYYEQEHLESAYGSCCADMPGMVATLCLNTTWPEPVTDEKVRETARHEVLELLLQPLWHAVLARALDHDWAESQRHGAIRRLEALLNRFQFSE